MSALPLVKTFIIHLSISMEAPLLSTHPFCPLCFCLGFDGGSRIDSYYKRTSLNWVVTSVLSFILIPPPPPCAMELICICQYFLCGRGSSHSVFWLTFCYPSCTPVYQHHEHCLLTTPLRTPSAPISFCQVCRCVLSPSWHVSKHLPVLQNQLSCLKHFHAISFSPLKNKEKVCTSLHTALYFHICALPYRSAHPRDCCSLSLDSLPLKVQG